jgi:hypothetical protein
MKRILLVISLLTLVYLSLPAQVPPPPPPSPTGGGTYGPVGGDAPIGNGIFILLASGLIYFVKKSSCILQGKEDKLVKRPVPTK